jgi:glycosyltransferase involved in cell wall biosynthesis
MRAAVVIHPPVDTERFTIPHEKHGVPNVRKGFVITGRQTPYKRIDLAIQACSRLNVPLIVIGTGPEHARLEKLAGKTITFLKRVSDQELPHYLQTAEAFLFPGVDDFGIAPVEALAAGTPVIAYKAGGALDYVIEGKTGMLFEKQTVDSLAAAISSFSAKKFDPKIIKEKAQDFSQKAFCDNMLVCINEITGNLDER